MANLGKYRFESDETRQKWLKAYGYKTPYSLLVNVFISEDNHEEKPYMVECIVENQTVYSSGKEINVHL
jgi:hypothetical protein